MIVSYITSIFNTPRKDYEKRTQPFLGDDDDDDDDDDNGGGGGDDDETELVIRGTLQE